MVNYKNYDFIWLITDVFVLIVMMIGVLLPDKKGKTGVGGADLLYSLVIAASMREALYVLLVSFILPIPYLAYMKITNKEHKYPFLPFMTTATIIVIFLKIRRIL